MTNVIEPLHQIDLKPQESGGVMVQFLLLSLIRDLVVSMRMKMYLSEVYGEGGIYAKVVAASIANDIPIYTLETKAPKFIDAEFEKHRMLSSNSSSSRAIPFKELDEIYIPFDIRKNQKGMQGYERVPERDRILFQGDMVSLFGKTFYWLHKYFSKVIHKQHLNRYLEPWMYQKKVVTATEWDNFFRLRLAPDAQPEIQELAKCMKEAMAQAEPKILYLGQWHLPYVPEYDKDGNPSYYDDPTIAIKCSVARCARVSYMNHDNTEPNIDKDLELADMLLENGHMTPFEHQATPMRPGCLSANQPIILSYFENGITHIDVKGNRWSANFRGWVQNRQLPTNEKE
jgi:thymidylate synthase ThyX